MHLTELHIYPIKSARGIALPSARLDAFGFEFDRRWMLVDNEGKFLTQRTLPRMALIRVNLQADHLAVDAEGCSELMIPFDLKDRKAISVNIWDDSVEATDVGDESARWFTAMLEQPCRLVYMSEHSRRLVKSGYTTDERRVSFADAFPVLLISQESLDDLNARLPHPVPMNRFRPNLVVAGCKPYEEDNWSTVRIGDVVFQAAKPCARCAVPSVEQDTGVRGHDPVRTLAAYRTRSGKVYFGQNMIHQDKGTLTLGDAITATPRLVS